MTRSRKIKIATALVVGLSMVWLTAEHLRGKWALAAWEKAARARGEKITVEELAPDAPQGCTNGTDQLLSAASLLPFDEAVTELCSRRTVGPGKAVWLLPHEDWRGFMDAPLQAPVTNLSWTYATASVKAQAPQIRQMRSALKTGRLQFCPPLSHRNTTPDFGNIRRAATWIFAEAMTELHEGTPESTALALTDGAILLQLQSEPDILCQMTRRTAAHTGMRAMWQALQTPGWSENQLAGMQAAWNSFSLFEAMLRAMETDRASGRIAFYQCRQDSQELDGLMRMDWSFPETKPLVGYSWLWQEFDEGWKNVRSTLRPLIYAPLWHFAWADQDELRHLIQHDRMMQDIRRSFSSQSLLAAQFIPRDRDRKSIYRLSDDFRLPISKALSREFYVNTWIGAAQVDTERQMLVTAIALKRHHLRHGKYPAQLSDLVPHYLARLPVDLMDGQTLRYRAKEDGTYLLYSVGEDGKDDGGDASLLKNSHRLTHDNVWPWPATAGEVKAFVAGRKDKRR